MRKTIWKFLAAGVLASVVVLLGTFPSFASAHGRVDMLAVAAATAPFAAQTKVLWVIGLVYAALQGVKKFLPVTGLGAVIVNVVFSVAGVVVIVRPQDLFSAQTLIAVITAGVGAAGIHGTVRSFQ